MIALAVGEHPSAGAAAAQSAVRGKTKSARAIGQLRHELQRLSVKELKGRLRTLGVSAVKIDDLDTVSHSSSHHCA